MSNIVSEMGHIELTRIRQHCPIWRKTSVNSIRNQVRKQTEHDTVKGHAPWETKTCQSLFDSNSR